MANEFSATLVEVRAAARKRILFLPHAIRQMARPDRMILTADIRAVISGGKIIEDYPEDARGHSCLMLGFDDEKRPIHLVCAPKDEYLAIITAYLPDTEEWSADLSIRI